jgi:uncharacterized membrane protein SirB2
MLEAYYAEIRLAHVGAVIASGSLFAVRGVTTNLLGSPWGMAAPVRYLSYAIDTVLLAAALTLVTILRQYPGIDAWLTVKVALLIVYIALGSFALKRARTLRARMVCWIGALAVYAFIASVALTHNPMGVFAIDG